MILDTITKSTRRRVDGRKYVKPLKQVMREALLYAERDRGGGYSFEKALLGPRASLICEVRRVPPFKSLVAPGFPYVDITREYEQEEAGVISILTESELLLGSDRYPEEIHWVVSLLVLRRDFTLDQYQIYEAKTLGTSAVLLIRSPLGQAWLVQCMRICREPGPGALVGAHPEREVSMAVKADAAVIRIDNRNLKTFEVDFPSALRLRKLIGRDAIFVAESGIRTAKDIKVLAETQVNVVLINEMLMRASGRKMALTGLRGNEGAVPMRS